ncbi:MAG: hypothetical protein KAJ14_02695 [Candidatus Omnitrophica bacterium]|nr:hypothetical protein [Candidatus Omnitrophota bacterium]
MKLSKSQALAEYSIGLAVILSVAFGMQTYIRRGLSRRYKNVVNHVVSSQHKPYYVEERLQIKQSKRMSDKMKVGGGRERKYTDDSITVKGEILQKTTYSPFDTLRLPGLFKF